MNTKRTFHYLGLILTAFILAACTFGPHEPAPEPTPTPMRCVIRSGFVALATAVPGGSVVLYGKKYNFSDRCELVSIDVGPIPTLPIIPTLTPTPVPPQSDAAGCAGVDCSKAKDAALPKGEFVRMWSSSSDYTQLIAQLDTRFNQMAGPGSATAQGSGSGWSVEPNSVIWTNFLSKQNIPAGVICLDCTEGETYGVFWTSSAIAAMPTGGRAIVLDSPLEPSVDLPGYVN